MNDDFDHSLDRTIADGLRRRADTMPVIPLGFGDVQHRIARTRQRTATFAVAAMMVPAVVGLGYLAGRRDDGNPVSLGSPDGVPTTTILLSPTTAWPQMATTTMPPVAAGYRCQGQQGGDDIWTYYSYCEPVGVGGPAVPMTTTFITAPPFYPTTTFLPDLLFGGELVVVDASGGLPVDQILASRGITTYGLLPGRRTVSQSMIVPIGDDMTLASRVLELLPLMNDFDGFDTWDSTLIDGPVPGGATAVLVLGADALDSLAPAPTTTFVVPCSVPGVQTTPPDSIFESPVDGVAPTTTTC